MNVIAVDHVQLAYPPGGEAAARAYYCEVLGCTERPKPEPLARRGGMWLMAGMIEIHLGLEDGMKPSLKAHPALRISDFDATVARLVAAGCEWREDQELPGVRRGHTRDPFGNRIELIAG